MRKIIPAFIAFIISPFLSYGQIANKIAHEAFVITRMVNKFHVQPRPVNDVFSSDVFSGMLTRTDDDKIFFTKNDISRLSVYTKTLDAQIKQRKTDYLNLFINVYQQRLKQVDSLIGEICKKPFDFYITEKFTGEEHTSYPASLAAMQQKLYKKMKADVLDDLIDDLPANFKSLPQLKQKKYIDSAEVVLRKRVASSLKRKINNILQSPNGIAQYVGDLYCETIA